MGPLLVVLKLIYIVVCIALTTIVILQKGKSAGLSGAISGAAETYWGKNKARSMEGKLERATVIIAGVFILLTVIIVVLQN